MKEYFDILIILPVLNEEKYLERCINSVLRQNFKNWKILSQDNYSDDKTTEILDKYAKLDNRISYRKSKIRLNAAESFNSCAEWALKSVDSEYIMWLSGDDFLIEENYLSALVSQSTQNNKNYLSCPKFLLQSEELPSQKQLFEMDLGDKNMNKRLFSFMKSWLNVCVMYAFYPREVFEDIFSNPKSKLSEYLGSDWWWSYFVVKNYNVEICNVTYRKTHHEDGWRHGNVVKSSKMSLRNRIASILLSKFRFLNDHFIKNRKRFNLLSDPWVSYFFIKTIFSIFAHYLKIMSILFQKSLRKFSLIKKKSA